MVSTHHYLANDYRVIPKVEPEVKSGNINLVAILNTHQ